jgi:V8-like Glu-specific endopeptidase
LSCGVYNILGAKDMILAFDKELLLYKISTKSGQSGSPIIIELYGGEYFIIGIHIMAYIDEGKNAGVRLTK